MEKKSKSPVVSSSEQHQEAPNSLSCSKIDNKGGSYSKWMLREGVQWRYAPLIEQIIGDLKGKSLRYCGKVSISKNHGTTYTTTGIEGVYLCRGWFCSVCSYKRAFEAAEKMERGIRNGLIEGEEFKFLTLTMNTDNPIALQQVLYADALASWRKKMKEWVKRNRKISSGFAFSFSHDITIRDNGTHHLHIHGIAQHKQLPPNSIIQKFWNKAVIEAGKQYDKGLSPKKDACFIEDVRPDNLDSLSLYINKYLGAPKEVVGSMGKTKSISTSMNFRGLLEKLMIDEPRKVLLRAYTDLIRAFSGIAWSRIGRRLADFAKLTEAEAENPEDQEEKEEGASIQISWFNHAAISGIRGGQSRIISGLKTPESDFIKEVINTNNELSMRFCSNETFSDEDWDEIKAPWERLFGIPVEWWAYGAEP